MMHTDYSNDPELYDLTLEGYTEDLLFYRQEALAAHGPCLELGCGTGRLLIPIAQAGVTVTGLDLSAAMLGRAQHKVAQLPPAVRQQITLHVADMRSFALAQQYALIYVPFRSFTHLLSVADQLAALATIRRHLRPDGRLILNFFDPSLLLDALRSGQPPSRGPLQPTGQHFIAPDSGHRMVEWVSVTVDYLAQRVERYLLYDVVDHDGTIIKRFERLIVARFIFRWEFEHLLARSGFAVEALYGSFARDPVTTLGSELIWIARPLPTAATSAQPSSGEPARRQDTD